MSEKKEETVVVGLEKIPLKTEREEKKNRIKRIIVTITLCILFCIIGFAGGTIFNNLLHPNYKTDATNTLGEIEAILKNNWIYANDHEDLIKELEDKAFYGMTSFEEDPYTTYMSSEELNEFSSNINRDYVGIGIQYSTATGKAVVSRVFKESPAEKAGFEPGDIIEAVDGKSIENLSTDEIKELVLGEPNTEVVITITRKNEKLDLICIRDSVDNSVYCYAENDYVVMELSSFGVNTGKDAIAYLDEYADYEKIIIDLRNNSGGYQTSVKEIAGLFIGNNEVYLIQKDIKGNEHSDVTSCSKTYRNFKDIILLVNRYTASAAEVLTICLKEKLPFVTIVGETTYGKGVIQSTNYLLNGGVLKYTSYNWYSPNGVSIHETGIKPDVEVMLDDVAYEYYEQMNEDEEYRFDSVSEITRICEISLNFLGYDVDRNDGYFDKQFENALNAYKADNGLENMGVLDTNTYESIISDTILTLSMPEKDYQFIKAIELIKN